MSGVQAPAPGGCMAEFACAEHVLDAARRLRALGYTALEIHAPYEIPGAAEILAVARPRVVPRATLVAGLLGAASGYGVQWYSSTAYPAVVGSRPAHAPPAFVPVTFELGVLFAAFAAFFALLAGRPRLRLWQPVFEVPGFARATLDRYWLHVDARDPRYDAERTRAALAALEPLCIEALAEEP